MSYCQFDDHFHSETNAFLLSLDACGMLLRAHSWIADNLTDGWIEEPFLVVHGRGRKAKRAIEELVAKGWWAREKGRYFSRTYLQDNPTREEVETRKASARARKEEWRKRQAQEVLKWNGEAAAS